MMVKKEWDYQSVPNSFWERIEQAQGDHERFRALLADLTEDELREMYWQYQELAEQLLSRKHIAHMDPNATEDTVMDVANWVVMQGKEFYNDVRRHPEKTPRTRQGRGPSFLSTIVRDFRARFGTAITS